MQDRSPVMASAPWNRGFPIDAVSGWHPLIGEEQNCCSDFNNKKKNGVSRAM